MTEQPIGGEVPRVLALSHDGWEHAHIYHWMMDVHSRGGITVILADLRPGGGPPMAFTDVMRVGYRGVIDPRERVRGATFSVIAKRAHQLHEQAQQQ